MNFVGLDLTVSDRWHEQQQQRMRLGHMTWTKATWLEKCRRNRRLQGLSPEFGLLVSPTRRKPPEDMSQDSECQTFPIFPLVQPVRAPSIFHGEVGDDPSRWLKEYERIAKLNRWDDTMCLANIAYFFLKGSARLWYENNEENLISW
ncbi:CCHC-type domain-containing protein [Trichonephila clavipes]|nr:CCHC-type domain-containing protein [Trichonephila clavipes]